jgi:hypothetical protein
MAAEKTRKKPFEIANENDVRYEHAMRIVSVMKLGKADPVDVALLFQRDMLVAADKKTGDTAAHELVKEGEETRVRVILVLGSEVYKIKNKVGISLAEAIRAEGSKELDRVVAASQPCQLKRPSQVESVRMLGRLLRV